MKTEIKLWDLNNLPRERLLEIIQKFCSEGYLNVIEQELYKGHGFKNKIKKEMQDFCAHLEELTIEALKKERGRMESEYIKAFKQKLKKSLKYKAERESYPWD